MTFVEWFAHEIEIKKLDGSFKGTDEEFAVMLDRCKIRRIPGQTRATPEILQRCRAIFAQARNNP